MIPPTEELVSSPEKGRRSYAATKDKSWSGSEVDIESLLQQVRESDVRVAMQLELQRAFGLRTEESWKLKPRYDRILEPTGDWKLHVLSGTKGGRHRLVPITTDYQWDVLERAKNIAGGGSTTPPTMREKEWRNHYYWILRKHKITRRGLGITAHGLRHEYANDRFKERLGVDSPVRGGDDPDLSREETNLGKRQISEELGHSRTSIVTAYTGSKRSVKKPKLQWSLNPDPDKKMDDDKDESEGEEKQAEMETAE